MNTINFRLVILFLVVTTGYSTEKPNNKATVLVTNQQGQALSDVRVTEYVTSKEYTTNDNGRFICELSEETRYFYAVDKYHKLAEAKRLDPDEKQLQIHLAPARIVSGQVLGPDGKPVPSTQVTALPMTDFYVLSDNEGKFVVGWLPEWEPDENMCLCARHISRNMASVVDIDRESENVRIELTPALTLAGSIENSKGTPIRGARVRLNLLKGWQATTSVKDVFTDNQGHFEINTLPQRQEYRISASYKNYYPNLTTIGAINKITEREEIDPIVLTAPDKLRETHEGTGTLTINIIDDYGKGVDDIYVMIWTRFEDGSARGFRYSVVSSGKPGLYEIPDIKIGQYHAMTVDKEEFVRFKKDDVEIKQDNNQPITCVLSKGGIIEGMVTDNMNIPVEGIPIVVNSVITRIDCITDKQGRFIARHTPDTNLSVIARPRGDSPYEFSRPQSGILSGQKDIHIIMKKKEQSKAFISLIGKNISEITKLKLPFNEKQVEDKMALLCFFDMQQRPSRNCIMQIAKQAQGLKEKGVVIVAVQTSKVEQKKFDEWIKENNISFNIGMIEGDSEKIRFAWGVKSLPWLILTYKQHIVRAEGFGLDELNFQIVKITNQTSSARRISGIVRDKTGIPLEAVEIKVFPAMSNFCISDTEGRFNLEYEPKKDAGAETDYYISARDEARNLAAYLIIDEKTESTDLRLMPAIILKGTVFDSEGQTIANADVSILIRGANWKGTIVFDTVQTDAKGRFSFEAVSPELGISNVVVTAKGYSQHFVNRIDMYEAENNILTMKTIILLVANLSVSGVVVDENDKPIPGATVRVLGGGEPRTDTLTDTEGKFKVDKLNAGGIRIKASYSGDKLLEGFVDSNAGATNVKVKLAEVYEPSQPLKSIMGKSLPELKSINIDLPSAELKDKKILICFFDMQQRPSRNCIMQIAKQAQGLKEKGVVIVAVQTSKVEQKNLDEWIKENNISFPVGMVEADQEEMRFTWGVKSLPWLILTDKEHIVRAEGFGIDDVDDELVKISEG